MHRRIDPRTTISILLGVCALASACTRGPEPGPLPEGQPPAAAAPAVAQPTSQPAEPAAPAPQPAAAAPAGAHAAGGLTWTAAAPLTARAPKSKMRAAEYGVPGVDGKADAELTVFYFGPGQGGSVDANLERWIGQMKRADGSPAMADAKRAKRKVGAIEVSTLDVAGTFSGGMGGGGPVEDARMLAIVAVGPEGPVFFKLVGPAVTVASAEQAFNGLVESLH